VKNKTILHKQRASTTKVSPTNSMPSNNSRIRTSSSSTPSNTCEDYAGAIVLLTHPPIFHDRLCELFYFSRTMFLFGRGESENFRL